MIRSAVAVVLMLMAATAIADESPEEEARRHYESGTTAYNLGNFLQAAEEYKLAYRLRPESVILYNIAQAYRLGNDPAHALFFYRSFIHNVPGSPNRDEVVERIKRLEAQLAEQRAIVAQPPNTTVKSGALPPSPEPKPVVVVVETSTPVAKAKPVYKRWWLWTVVGVVAVGAGLGVGLGLGLSPSNPSSHFGTSTVQF